MENENKELLTRGVEKIFPSTAFLEEKLKKGEKISLFLGIDPTGPTLHLGHAIILKKLRDFQKAGHQIILLIGDFTGMIGDPTDKSAARKKLTREEVLKNSARYKDQASVFLDFGGKNPAQLKYNSEWLAKMSFEDVVNLASHFTVQQMLERDMFEKRMKEGKPISLHEFMYPLMQGYDSVAMKVDGEIGGNDQTFNMLAGRDLMKGLLNKEKFVIAMKLLEDSTGKKMGKTEGNMVSLDQSASEMFGKVMSWTDGLIVPGFTLCTDVLIEKIETIKKDLEKETNPKDAKVSLAKEIVTLYHGKDAAEKAQEDFENTFKKGGIPEDTKEVSVAKDTLLVEVLLKEKIIESKNELRRLVDEGAVSVIETGEKITDINYKISQKVTLKIGKRRFIKITT
ncbi:MAG: tyrosine--tRNA ligase [Candidatus Taylorbacteria bacterium]|nr:tyrosine--tRNA ligase [Candidatus Taylorbacteria bacterium]